MEKFLTYYVFICILKLTITRGKIAMKKNYLTQAFQKVAVYGALALTLGVGTVNRANAQTVKSDSTEQTVTDQTKPWANDAEYKAQINVLRIQYEASLEKLEADRKKSVSQENNNYGRSLTQNARNGTRAATRGNVLDKVLNGSTTAINAGTQLARHNANLKTIQANYESRVASTQANFAKQIQNLDARFERDYEKEAQKLQQQNKPAKLTKGEQIAQKGRDKQYAEYVDWAVKQGVKIKSQDEFNKWLDQKAAEKKQQQTPGRNR